MTDVQDELVKEEKTSSPPIELSISPTIIKFKGKGGKPTQVAVICNSSWTVESAPTWVKYNVSDNIITIEAEKNSTKEERTGTLIIKSGDKVVHLNIIQARIKTLGIF